MNKALKYITNSKKTDGHLITAIGCEKDSAYYEMIAVKRAYGKDTGRQFIHFVQSFAPYDKVTPEIAHEIAVKLSDKLEGFQMEMATHTDTEHIHTHFIVNTVNYETGLKWKKSAKDLQDLKDYSDQLCREYGLIITHKQKDAYKKGGEFRAEQQGQSWKHELYLAASHCLKNSSSKDEFINNMTKLGYKVLWTEERKYITFTSPDGKKCRNKKLGEKFTKENMEKTFELNKRYAHERVLQGRMNLLLESLSFLCQQSNSSNSSKYPLSALEGQALKEKAIEMQSRGLDWDKAYEEEH